MSKIKRTALWLGPVLACIIAYLTLSAGLGDKAAWTAAITTVCAVWWIFEPIPIPATSLIPFAAFPFAGVIPHGELSRAYGHTLILLLLAGFILSTAMEKSGAHRRIAVAMIRLVGGKGGRRLVLGFMLATAVLSMWISNTATVLMLLPVAMAILESSEDEALAVPLLLGIAYAASIGGLGTPIGTPPNVIFMGIYEQTTGSALSFIEWMSFGIPACLILIPIAWFVLVRKLDSNETLELPTLGSWSTAERRILSVFALTAIAWTTRTAPLGGWSELFGLKSVGDSTVAMTAVVMMFLIPDGNDGRLLDWKTANKIPWGLLILFAGGIAIAIAFQETGLSVAMGKALGELTTLPALVMVLIICLSVTFLTEITSNTASTTLLMPVLAATAIAANLDPKMLMIPAALSASCAFMLPVATAPNAIVFGTNLVPIQRMAREGLLLNLIGALALTLICAVLVL